MCAENEKKKKGGGGGGGGGGECEEKQRRGAEKHLVVPNPLMRRFSPRANQDLHMRPHLKKKKSLTFFVFTHQIFYTPCL